MRKMIAFLFAGVLISALCMACGGSTPPVPPEQPEPPEVPKEPQEVSFYYRGDQKIELTVREDKVITKTASNEDAKVLCENEIFIFEGIRWPQGEYIIASIDPATTTIEDVRKVTGVLSATYGLEGDFGLMCWPTDQIFVKPVEGTSIGNIIDEAVLSEYIKETELSNPYSGSYLITLNLNLEHILWASNELFETELCEYAEPSFYREAQLGNE